MNKLNNTVISNTKITISTPEKQTSVTEKVTKNVWNQIPTNKIEEV